MRRPIPASIAAFSLLLIFAAPASAQVHGVPTSVTSTGFGGHFDRFPGVRTSVTSTGPGPVTPADHAFHSGAGACCINPLFPANPNPPRNGPRRPHRPVSGAIYVPYAYPAYYAGQV